MDTRSGWVSGIVFLLIVIGAVFLLWRGTRPSDQEVKQAAPKIEGVDFNALKSPVIKTLKDLQKQGDVPVKRPDSGQLHRDDPFAPF